MSLFCLCFDFDLHCIALHCITLYCTCAASTFLNTPLPYAAPLPHDALNGPEQVAREYAKIARYYACRKGALVAIPRSLFFPCYFLIFPCYPEFNSLFRDLAKPSKNAANTTKIAHQTRR